MILIETKIMSHIWTSIRALHTVMEIWNLLTGIRQSDVRGSRKNITRKRIQSEASQESWIIAYWT
jgi:hypothetical protein